MMHLAAESHVDRSIDGPGEFIQTNIVGTFTLLQEALRYWRGLDAKPAQSDFRFLHISTDEVFGSLGAEGAFTENTVLTRPTRPIPQARHPPIIWFAPGDETYDLPASSPTVRTITARIIFPKSSFRT